MFELVTYVCRKDVLDAALTRPGRFDRSIEVSSHE
jgi:ATP-dependent 26S proteasome regulatory subunit